jgi:transposase
MIPYSDDLRSRAIRAYERREGSMAQIAARYEISIDTFCDWWRRYSETGSYLPLPHSGGSKPILSDEDRDHILQTALECNDATLEDLRDDLFAQRGVYVSTSTVSNVLQDGEITRKKRHGTRPSAKRWDGKPSATPTNKK